MQIERYRERDVRRLDNFGSHYVEQRVHFDWYIGKDKVGLTPNDTTTAANFVEGIFDDEDGLIVNPMLQNPSIRRRNNSLGVMQGVDCGINEINKLIQMLQENETTYMYTSYVKESTGRYFVPYTLTFSPVAPNHKKYHEGKLLPIIMDESEERLYVDTRSVERSLMRHERNRVR